MEIIIKEILMMENSMELASITFLNLEKYMKGNSMKIISQEMV